MAQTAKPRLAVDIGGTFTDIAVESPTGLFTAKTLTTPLRPVEGVLNGIALALGGADLMPTDFGAVVHGTTLATNALIERRGAKVGVIATEGFRDILEIGYERRYDQYDLYLEKPDLIVPRDCVATVRERTGADGSVIDPIDPASLDHAIAKLIEAGVESVAVCLLHSYAAPTHEIAIREALAKTAPVLPVSLSHQVSPEMREFDRLCTTVANAYIQPLMADYLADLEQSLSKTGFDCPLFIVTSGGGMTTVETARAFPIRLVESGPSGGAILAAQVAGTRALDNVLSFDMGGTTAKVCLVEDGQPRSSRAFEIGRAERFMKGSGLPVRIPVIEMIEIGAGGGSIASVDRLGRLRVGPQSASSDPGPACYGRGGQLPTVTDADLVTGYLDPQLFAEGRLSLDPDKARQAIAREVSNPLDFTPTGGADGISQIVDEAMANAARMHAAEQGVTLADCAMIAFGGNGPLHATRVAERVGIGQIIVPPDPSVGSAVGFLSAPVSYEIVRSYRVELDSFPLVEVNAVLDELVETAERIVRAGAAGAGIAVSRTAFMRYAGQGHEIEVAVPQGALTTETLADLVRGFETEYARLFGRIVPDMRLEVINWSVLASTAPPQRKPVTDVLPARTATSQETRELSLGQSADPVAARVFKRAELQPGDQIAGPALIVEPQTTTYVSDAFTARIDEARNIVMQSNDSQASIRTTAPSEIALQVMWDRLLAIVEEQAQVLMRTAFSPIVRECGDISVGVFDLQGQMLAQAVTGTPGHINTMAASVALMLERFPVSDMRPGEIFATNDPWIGSGHLNDLLLVAPIFDGERVVALTACTSHLYDLGGTGMGPDGSDVFDEGLFLPPLRLVEAGRVNTMLIDILKANSRSPDENEGDVYALIACCEAGSVRLLEMMRQFGLSDLCALGRHVLDTSLSATEAAINAIPPGVYENEVTLDGYDESLILRARMTIHDGRIETDFTGSSTYSRRGINVPLNYAAAYSVFAMRCVIGAEVPNNAGSLAPFLFTAPQDSILNAQPPAPVASRHVVGQMTSDLVLGCLHRALPGKVPAEGASCLWDLPIRSAPMASLRPGATTFAAEFTHSGGTGARPALDGLSATAFPSGVWGTQVEIAESTTPVLFRRRELITDSGGPGAFRGGLGQAIHLESAEDAPILLFAAVDRIDNPARGRSGGAAGRAGRIHLRSGPALAGKGEQEIAAGDLLIFETPGGGGYGDPLTRDADMVARDARQDLISTETAETLYGVVLDLAGNPDVAATATLRARLSKGGA
ncbi:MAG: hydantoinase B/oxoprolinase family protein [Pseudomonadota bacterium]